MNSSDNPNIEKFNRYESLGFEVIHEHRVNINPQGEHVEVDFSATGQEFLVQVAIKKAYEAGQRAGQEVFQEKMRTLLGLGLTARY